MASDHLGRKVKVETHLVPYPHRCRLCGAA